MEKEQFTQNKYVDLFPVAAKEGDLCKKKPDFKKMDKKRTLILLIGLSDNKKIRKFAKKENVRKITFSEIAGEIQEDNIETWNEFQEKVNKEFYKRVQLALRKWTAMVEKTFKSLDSRFCFLEIIMEKNVIGILGTVLKIPVYSKKKKF